MKLLKVASLTLTSFALITSFQNCGGVEFNPGLANAELSSPFNEGGLNIGLNEDIEPGVEIVQTEPPITLEEVEGVPAPHKEEERKELETVLNQNEACRAHFGKIKAELFPWREKLHIQGIQKSATIVANVGELQINGITKSIVGKNIDVAGINGIHDSICLQAKRIDMIVGITKGVKADMVLIGPENEIGYADHLSGINRSDLVLVNYEVKMITGIGRNLHVFGGRIHKVSGIFDEIHLYNGAVIENLHGIHRNVIRH